MTTTLRSSSIVLMMSGADVDDDVDDDDDVSKQMNLLVLLHAVADVTSSPKVRTRHDNIEGQEAR